MNATRYGKLPYMLDQARPVTCSGNQHAPGGRGGCWFMSDGLCRLLLVSKGGGFAVSDLHSDPGPTLRTDSQQVLEQSLLNSSPGMNTRPLNLKYRRSLAGSRIISSDSQVAHLNHQLPTCNSPLNNPIQRWLRFPNLM